MYLMRCHRALWFNKFFISKLSLDCLKLCKMLFNVDRSWARHMPTDSSNQCLTACAFKALRLKAPLDSSTPDLTVYCAEQTFLDEGKVGEGYALICVSPSCCPLTLQVETRPGKVDPAAITRETVIHGHDASLGTGEKVGIWGMIPVLCRWATPSQTW
jgi:hypothetical protein